jgi:hypothetical protein
VSSARFLFAMFQGGGNIALIVPVVERLVERGHHLRVLAGPGIWNSRIAVRASYRDRITTPGATFVHIPEPVCHPLDRQPAPRGVLGSWLPAVSHLLGKRGQAIRVGDRWICPRTIQEVVEQTEAVPLPARWSAWAVDDGIGVEVVTRVDTPEVRSRIRDSVKASDVPLRQLRLVTSGTMLRRAPRLRCDAGGYRGRTARVSARAAVLVAGVFLIAAGNVLYALLAGVVRSTRVALALICGLLCVDVGCVWVLGASHPAARVVNNLLVAALFPLVQRKTFGPTAGRIALGVHLVPIGALECLAAAGALAHGFPVMVALAPLVALQYFIWSRSARAPGAARDSLYGGVA